MNKPAINEHSEIYRLAKKLDEDIQKSVEGPGEMTNIEEQAEVLVQEIMDMVPTDILELSQRDIDSIAANLDEMYEDADRMENLANGVKKNVEIVREILGL